jgi:hypothetical protein
MTVTGFRPIPCTKSLACRPSDASNESSRRITTSARTNYHIRCCVLCGRGPNRTRSSRAVQHRCCGAAFSGLALRLSALRCGRRRYCRHHSSVCHGDIHPKWQWAIPTQASSGTLVPVCWSGACRVLIVVFLSVLGALIPGLLLLPGPMQFPVALSAVILIGTGLGFLTMKQS